MKTAIFLSVFLLCSSLLAQPATAPSTGSLLKGEITFTIPDEWKLDGKTPDDKLAKLSRSDPQGAMAVNVNVQPQALRDSDAPALSQHVVKMILDHAKAGDYQLIEQPKAEKDDRFFMRIHHKFQKGSLVGDELQIYRLIGNNLITVAATAFTDSPDESKQIFGEAEKTLLSVKSSKGGAGATPVKLLRPATRPTALPAAKIAFNAPAGWEEQTNDNTSGIVATYHDPVESFNTMVISIRPLPPEAKKDPKARDVIVDEMVKGENASFKLDGANQVGDVEPVKDNRFLKKTKLKYEKADAKLTVTSRVKRVGDVIVNVAMVALEPGATDIDRLADEVAVSVRPSR
jgi:hypothetical protein